MLDLGPAIKAVLLLSSELSTAVGGARIFPDVMPQGERRPSIVYNEIPGPAPDYTMDGPSGLVTSLMQIDAWAEDPDAAELLSRLVREQLSGYSGVIAYGSNSPQDQVVIQGIFAQSEGDDHDDDAKLYRSRRDYRVFWEDP